MKRKSIFNISEEYFQLMNEIEESEGLLTEDIEQRLKINADDLEDKLKNYYYLIKTIEGTVVTIDDEIKRLQTVKSIKTNLIHKLKNTVKDAVMLFGEDGKSGNKVIDYDTIKFYTRKNEQLKFNDIDSFFNTNYINYSITEKLTNDEFIKILEALGLQSDSLKYKVTINKASLKSALKDKVEIEGVSLIRNDSIIIK